MCSSPADSSLFFFVIRPPIRPLSFAVSDLHPPATTLSASPSSFAISNFIRSSGSICSGSIGSLFFLDNGPHSFRKGSMPGSCLFIPLVSALEDHNLLCLCGIICRCPDEDIGSLCEIFLGNDIFSQIRKKSCLSRDRVFAAIHGC